MTKKTIATQNFDDAIHKKIKWLKVLSFIRDEIKAADDSSIVSLLTIAQMTTQYLHSVKPDKLKSLARNQTLWPVLKSPFKNDQTDSDILRSIDLANGLPIKNTSSNLQSIYTRLAVNAIQQAYEKRDNASRFFSAKARSNKAKWKELKEHYLPFRALPPLSARTLSQWWKLLLKPYIDAQYPRHENSAMLQALAKSRGINAADYDASYKLKNHFRKHVKQAIITLLKA